MAVYNTPSDAANTAVRAFLTAVGEFYYGSSFNTGNGKGEKVWNEIKEDFGNRCAYCDSDSKLQVEHLVMFNRTEYGLHHPGNIVPVCAACNKRAIDENKKPVPWDEQLRRRNALATDEAIMSRLDRIHTHIKKYEYPHLSYTEQKAIAVIAESLYTNIKSESQKALELYKKLDEAFVEGAEPRNAADSR
jgi:hypothetical protein